jgi:hypothetical protein
MDGFSRRLLVAAILAVGLTTSAASAAAPVRLLAPGDGMVLAAGSTASLEWAPLDGLARQEGWEEWEAFLSLDGGATYPVRITPHLDRELRRVTFDVPDLPTRNARLLLRVGDEHRETAFELPERFAIAMPSLLAGRTIDLPRTAWRRGEPARPGEPGVLVWAEGSRHGGQLREVVAAEPPRVVPSGIAAAEGIPAPTAVATEEPPSGAPATDLVVLSIQPPPRAGTPAGPRTPRAAAADLLLLLQRQNE